MLLQALIKSKTCKVFCVEYEVKRPGDSPLKCCSIYQENRCMRKFNDVKIKARILHREFEITSFIKCLAEAFEYFSKNGNSFRFIRIIEL